MILDIQKLFLWFAIYSLAGWVYETILCSCVQKRFVYRGFLMGPYCPIYGFGAIFDILLFAREESWWVIFLGSMVVSSVLEYFTAWLLEVFFHAKWWDYSNRRFNIKGRVCLLGAVAFGGMSTVLIKWLHPYVALQTGKINSVITAWVSSAIFVLMITDCIFTVRGFVNFEEKLRRLTEDIEEKKEKLKRLTEDVEEKREKIIKSASNIFAIFAKSMTRHEKRMIEAFPKLKSVKYNDALTALKNWRKRH